MSDLFNRYNPFRPTSPTKRSSTHPHSHSHSRSHTPAPTPIAPGTPKTAPTPIDPPTPRTPNTLSKSKSHSSRPKSPPFRLSTMPTTAHTTSHRAPPPPPLHLAAPIAPHRESPHPPCAPSRPSSSLESPLLPELRGQYLLDTSRSIELDRPVFTPAPHSPRSSTPITPVSPRFSSSSMSKSARAKMSKRPSILRSLAHHPSLSALRSKRNKNKDMEEEVPPLDRWMGGDAGTPTPGKGKTSKRENEGVDDEVESKGGLWGSVRRRKSRKSLGGLKGAKSVPALRMSKSSDEWRTADTPVPVPALPERFAKSTTPPFTGHGLFDPKCESPDFTRPGEDIQISLDGSAANIQYDKTPPRKLCRGRSEDLSPSPNKRSPARHMSTPPDGSKIQPISPPRHSMPPGTGGLAFLHRMGGGLPPHFGRRSMEEYNPDDYGDLSPSRQSQEVLAETNEPRHQARRLFSREAASPAFSDSPISSTPTHTPSGPPAPLRSMTATPFSSRNASTERSESPFEVKFSPMVSKRMSLEAFGQTENAKNKWRSSEQSLPESVEHVEMLQDQELHDTDDPVPAPLADPLDNTLEGWTGTQLTTIKESPSSAGTYPEIPDIEAGEPRTPIMPSFYGGPMTGMTARSGMTAFYTPQSVMSDADSEGDDSFSSRSRKLRIKSHVTGKSVSESLLSVQNEHFAELEQAKIVAEDNAREAEAEVERLKGEVREGEKECEAAWDVISGLEERMRGLEGQLEEKESALISLREAMMENEEFFDQLQAAHDSLAEQIVTCQRDLEVAQQDKCRLEDEAMTASSTKADLVFKLGAAEDALSECRAEIGLLRKDKLELDDVKVQLHATTEDLMSHLSGCNVELASLKSGLAEKEALLSLCESDLKAHSAREAELLEEVRKGEKRLLEKESLVEQLRDKLATKRFEMDEMMVGREGQAKEWAEEMRKQNEKVEMLEKEVAEAKKDQLAWEAEKEDLADELDALREDLALKENLQRELEELDAQLLDTENALASSRAAFEQAQSELESRHGDMSLQQGEVDQLHAELDAANEKIHRLETQYARMAREHERALTDAKWDVSVLQEQLDSSNLKLADALMDRELSSATSADVASRLRAYLAEIERLKVVEGRLEGELVDVKEREVATGKKLDEANKQVEELREDKELLNVALESKAIENTLLQRQVPNRPGSTTPRNRLVASTSRLPAPTSMGASSAARLATSVHASSRRKIVRPISAAGAFGGTGTGVSTGARATSGASSSSAQSFVTATSAGIGANGTRIVSGQNQVGTSRAVKAHRRESSVQGTPKPGNRSVDVSSTSKIPAYGSGHSRRLSMNTPIPPSRVMPSPMNVSTGSVRSVSGGSVLGESTRDNQLSRPVGPRKTIGTSTTVGGSKTLERHLRRQSSVSSLESVSSVASVGSLGLGRAGRVWEMQMQRVRSLSGMVEVDEAE